MTNHFSHPFVVFLFLVCFVIVEISTVYGEQDIWMIDTQSVSWNQVSEEDFAEIKYLRFQNNQWEAAAAEDFFASQNPTVPLIVFCPGYTSTTANTVETGLGIIRLINFGKPYRMVFWNWHSQKILCGLRKDIRTKIPVAAANGKYMAMFLRSLKPQSKTALLGFSFGNRIIGDAVVQLGSGRPGNLQIRIVMAAPATDQNCLSKKGIYAKLSEFAEKTLILYNPRDFRLSFYPFLYGSSYRTNALGLNGPSFAVRQEFGDHLEAVNLAPYIGTKHQTLITLNTPPFRQRINTYLFFE